MNLYVVTCGPGSAYKNYQKTVESSVPISRITSHLKKNQTSELKARCKSVKSLKKIAMWGFHSQNHVKRWKGMQRGDVVLFERKEAGFFIEAKVLYTVENRDLAIQEWGSDPIFKYIFFLYGVSDIQIPRAKFNKIADKELNYSHLGGTPFGELDTPSSTEILKKISKIPTNSIFDNEVLDPDKRYFIFTTGRKAHRDKDFKYYTWNSKRYNLVSEGDLFIYRTPKKASASNKFYFFGAGKVRKIKTATKKDPQYSKDGDQYALISKQSPFTNRISQDDIKPGDIESCRAKNGRWNFHNLGMNEISKEEFKFLVDLGLERNNLGKGLTKKTRKKSNKTATNRTVSTEDNKTFVKAHNQIEEGNYTVEDKEAPGAKSRGRYQKAFRTALLTNYDNKCAITGINTKSLLIGAHIVGWAEDKTKRLDPKNGILLSKLVDKCYEDGLITIDTKFQIKLSPKIKNDQKLYSQLKSFENKKITLPKDKSCWPAKENLRKRYNKSKN